MQYLQKAGILGGWVGSVPNFPYRQNGGAFFGPKGFFSKITKGDLEGFLILSVHDYDGWNELKKLFLFSRNGLYTQ